MYDGVPGSNKSSSVPLTIGEDMFSVDMFCGIHNSAAEMVANKQSVGTGEESSLATTSVKEEFSLSSCKVVAAISPPVGLLLSIQGGDGTGTEVSHVL